MPINAWLRAPRHLVVLFLGITLVLIVALGWLGGRLLQQDRALERQRVQDRLELAADRAAAAFTRRLAAIEDSLARLSATPQSELPIAAGRYADQLASDALLVVLTADGLESFPKGRLIYHPVTSPEVPPASVFARGEALEFRERDYERAGRLFRSLAQSDDPAVRAGALLRLARIHRKADRLDAALAVYADLAQLGDTPVGELPAELVARFARLTVLEELSRVAELQLEADSLYADLYAGRWQITRAGFRFHTQEVGRYVGSDIVHDPGNSMSAHKAVALAEGVDRLWRDWRSGQPDTRSVDRRIVWVGDDPFLIIRVGSSRSAAGIIAGAGQLDDWLTQVELTQATDGVALAIADVQGKPIISRFSDQPEVQARRAAAETGLPLTLRVASASLDADFIQLAERRRVMLLGMSVVALLVLVSLYAVTRGVTRELEAARLKSDFVAAVSHEFRTPLTSMRQLTELLIAGRVASAERRALYYNVINRESERLHRLVEGLLDFGRMEAGALEFHLEDIEVGALVRELVDEFQQEVGERGYEIVLNGGGEGGGGADTYTVRADDEALKRALWNLLDNAVKYSPDCKTVWIDETPENGCIAIRVRDRGVGIARADQKAVFQKFFRGRGRQIDGVKGTGIGLAMVRHIVEAHGGEVQVESEPGAGSTFTVRLPLASD
ncbi:MAG: HAMP domain-containing histidine kinase [Gemmatimonadetes bacterium]|nr:HAMP domain-containing histidine kinase [Gemmatimonadota bacterium]